MSKRFGALVTVALLLGGAACSSDGAKPLSKAEFTKQAGVICTRVTKETSAAEPDDPSSASPKELSAAFDKVAEASNTAIGELGDLEAPKDQADAVQAALDLQQAATDKIKAIADDLRAGKDIPEAQYQELSKVGDKANAAWDEAGLKTCGSDS